MGYYADKLSGERLRKCYEIAPPRVQQYLAAEIQHVLSRVGVEYTVLELGCGYGRVVFELARIVRQVVGIDTSLHSLALAQQLAKPEITCEFISMDAANLGFADDTFDAVVCIQNGICAFGIDQVLLLREALRVTRQGGTVLLSSYAERFWPHRYQWFELQAGRGLIGEIDHDSTRNGVIVCKDGFRAGAMSPNDFRELCLQLGLRPKIEEVDGSSLFCEVNVSSKLH